MRAWVWSAASLAGSWGSSGCQAEAFQCEQHTECGAQGECESNGYCSFPDDVCASGRRFGKLAVAGVANECVPDSTSPDPPSTSGTTGGPQASSDADPSLDPPTSSTTDSAGAETSPGLSAGSSETTRSSDSAGPEDGSTSGSGDGRVEEGLTVLYRFDEGDGDTVYDRSNVEPPLNLTLFGTGYEWSRGGLIFHGSDDTIALATEHPAKIDEACFASNAITLEAWLVPAEAKAQGPTRVITYSLDTSARNFTLGQGRSVKLPLDGWQTRLRSDATDGNGLPGLTESHPIDVGQPTHVVFARGHNGAEALYVDDIVIAGAMRAGDLQSHWVVDGTMDLAVGNEIPLSRPFRGEILLVAIYCRALSAAEVGQNFAAGFMG